MAECLETVIDKFVFRVATDRFYSSEGVWALSEGNRVRVGVSDYVQQRNGDVAFAHVRPAGTKLLAGDELAELETIKATVSVLSPVAGQVVEVNPELELSPELVNQDAYGKGWLAIVDAADWATDRARLLDPQTYLSAIRAEAEKELGPS
jgi:glycine cleavage system H protein